MVALVARNESHEAMILQLNHTVCLSDVWKSLIRKRQPLELNLRMRCSPSFFAIMPAFSDWMYFLQVDVLNSQLRTQENSSQDKQRLEAALAMEAHARADAEERLKKVTVTS